MTFIETNSRTFREKQKDFFDYAENGETVIIKRKKQYYKLTPVDKTDLIKSVRMKKDKTKNKGL